MQSMICGSLYLHCKCAPFAVTSICGPGCRSRYPQHNSAQRKGDREVKASITWGVWLVSFVRITSHARTHTAQLPTPLSYSLHFSFASVGQTEVEETSFQCVVWLASNGECQHHSWHRSVCTAGRRNDGERTLSASKGLSIMFTKRYGEEKKCNTFLL